MGEHVRAGDLDIWTEQVGEGPDVLLIGGVGDTVESWQFQLDVSSAHVAGFSGGSIFCQELALRHPELVRSLVLQSTWAVEDRFGRSWTRFIQWLLEVAPSERAFLEAFFLWIYTPRAHNDGTVEQFIEEVLAFPYKQRTEDVQCFLDALIDHDTTDRLPQIAVPTLVLAGGRDITQARPEHGRAVAEL